MSQYGIGGGSDDTHHLLVFAPAGSGLTLMRTVAGVDKAVGLAVDPTTGRVWVSEREAGRVSAFTLDSISAKRLPPPLAEALPGPLDISWAPADVARSLGLTLIAMLLVGAPTPLFNHTLEGNLEEIRRMLRIDRISRRLRGRSAAWASVRAAISSSWFAFATYLLAAAVLLSLVERGFPSPDGLAILAATTLSMLVVTGAVLATQRGFRLRRGTERGHVRVVAWVLLLALGCVMVTKVSGASPAYVYGIIGAYEFGVVLTATDRGRLALQTGLVLLALALTAWFVRIPFEPTIAHPATGMVALLNVILVKVFVAGIEGVVIGFIPVRFMSGEDLFRWRPWLWFAVWGGAVLLFMHVILYAPTDFEPNPDTTPLLTILATVAVYSVVAIGFWWFFAWRRRRAIADAESQA